MNDSVMRIEPAVEDDAGVVHALHARAVRASCSAHYEPGVIKAWLDGRTPQGYLGPIRRGVLFVARTDGRIVGFGETAPGTVVAVYLDPGFGGRGAGSALLAHAVRRAGPGPDGAIRLESTLNAVGFYARHGFATEGPGTVRRNGTDVPIVRMVLRAG